MDESLKKAIDAINEIKNTGYCLVSIDFKNHNANRDEDDKKSQVWLDKARCFCVLKIYAEDSWDNICSVIAQAYTICDEAEKLYHYRASNPINNEALYFIMSHQSDKKRYQ